MIREFIASHLKPVIVGIITLGVLLIGLAIGLLVHLHATKPVTTATVVTPGYQTILPRGKTIKQLGGWQKFSPPDTTPYYAYVDKIGKVSINVSEQTIPDSFKDDTNGSVATFAQSYGATDVQTAGNTKVYIGTNANGPQSLIFIKDDVLVLIKSQAKINDKAWIDYINSLN